MKKLVTVFSTLAIACALSAPVFAKSPKPAKASAATTTATQKAKSKKLHFLHKKSGATTAKKNAAKSTTATAPAAK
ncbi:MAG TPA: hypothetical protein VKU44_08260 [Terriglobia bacterium]|nr:hypothetical protein [Terriglobia bacterium]